MPNMSYCRAENTLTDLCQILNDADNTPEGLLESFREACREEKAAAIALVAACQDYIDLFQYATEDPDYDKVFDRVPHCLGNEA